MSTVDGFLNIVAALLRWCDHLKLTTPFGLSYSLATNFSLGSGSQSPNDLSTFLTFRDRISESEHFARRSSEMTRYEIRSI